MPVARDTVKGASSHFDFAQLRLDISMPQSLMLQVLRGYVSPQNLDAGNTIGFINYSANQYHVSRSASHAQDSDSSYVALNSGLNLGMWRLRQQASLRYDSKNGSDWNATRTYVQRALPSLRSELTAGEGYTSGRFFSGLGFRGVQLTSDERMLPESVRGYAPTVRGIAKTNAKVTVRQNGNDIYEATVSRGRLKSATCTPPITTATLTSRCRKPTAASAASACRSRQCRNPCVRAPRATARPWARPATWAITTCSANSPINAA